MMAGMGTRRNQWAALPALIKYILREVVRNKILLFTDSANPVMCVAVMYLCFDSLHT